MPGKYLYEFAVIRVVPRVEREEFQNIGVIVYCKRERYLKAKYTLNKQKLVPFLGDLPIEDVRKNIEAFDHICAGNKQSGRVSEWDKADRFRWLTAVKSSSIQTSRPHIGYSDDLDETLDRIFKEQVL